MLAHPTHPTREAPGNATRYVPRFAASGPSAPKRHDEKHPHAERSEKNINQANEDTFPASDAPSTGGTTRIEPSKSSQDKHEKSRRPSSGKGGNA